ncbi:hypothetical protein ACFQHO_53435 [Actinomadura yumaensis]|uniref:hypothetical protein n=1 Tax=Actinomadura yumaensis TaxID=111807 RepID=UPI0036099A20
MIDAVNALVRVPWGDLRDLPLHLRVFATVHEELAAAGRQLVTRLEVDGGVDPRVTDAATAAPGRAVAAGEGYLAASDRLVAHYRGLLEALESGVRMPDKELLGNGGQRLRPRTGAASGAARTSRPRS